MAYRIEIGVDSQEGLFLPLAIRNAYTKAPMDVGNVDYQLMAGVLGNDYGCETVYGQVVASSANGMISSPGKGMLDLVVPFSAWTTCGPLFYDYGCVDLCQPQSIRARLIAAPAGMFDPTTFSGPFAVTTDTPPTVLVNFVFSFGRATMQRITLDVNPFFPNAASAGVSSCEVAQMKQFLATAGLYDAVEANLKGPTDPATISWNTGGDMTLSGPLAASIALSTGKTPAQMAAIMAAASLNAI